MSKRIKFGILCNSLVFEAWEAACIDKLLTHPNIELKLLVMNSQDGSTNQTFFQKLKHYPYKNFLYRAYKRYRLKAASYKLVSFESKLMHVPILRCDTIKKGKYSVSFNDQDVAKIKFEALDFMLRFGFNIISGEILKSCTYGIWSFHHADNDFIRGGPIGFWEIYLRRNTTAAVLQQLNDQLDQGKILRKGYLKTVDHSYAENIDQLTEMAAIWPLQVCIDILNSQDIIAKSPPAMHKAKLYKFPTNGTFLNFIFILMLNKMKFHIQQLFLSESWQIARYEQSIDELKETTLPTTSFISDSNAEIYCADPFLWPNENVKKLLFEHFSYQENKGKIAMMDYDGKNLKTIDFGINAHLSYPYLFEYNAQVYCLPEQAEEGHVSLYKINEDVAVTKVIDLVENFEARDASLVFYHQKWWLFCTKANYFENAALFVFHANSLLEKFVPHQNNPVKVDVQNARPAGSFFMKDKTLFRPAQNSAKHYGHKVNINKIIKLTEFEFEEEIVTIIEPEIFGNFIGIHHLVSQQGQTIVDLKQTKFSINNFSHQLKRKIKKKLKK